MGGFSFTQFRTMLNVIRRGEEHGDSKTDEMLGSAGKKLTPEAKRALAGAILLALCVGLFIVGMKAAETDLSITKAFFIMIAMLVVMVVVMGFYQAVSMLYFVKDMSFYLALPIPPIVVMAAKMTYFLLSQVVVNCVIVAFGLGFLTGRGEGVLSYISLILAFVPCVIACALALIIIVIPIMRFSRIAADKDKFARVFGVITTVVSIVIASLVSLGLHAVSDPSAMISSVGNTIGSGVTSVVLAIVCAPTLLATEVFGGNTALGLIGMYGLAIVYVAVMCLFAKLWYFEGVRGMQDGGGKKSNKRYSESELASAVKMRSQFKAFLAQDIASLVRIPTFFQQFVFMIVIEPIIVVIIGCLTLYMKDGEFFGSFFALLNAASIGEAGVAGNTYLLVIAVVVMVGFIGGILSYMNCFTLGRDGQDFFYLRTMPLNMKQYVNAKFFSGYLLSRVPVFVVLFIALIAIQIPIDICLLALIAYVLPTTTIDLVMFGIGSLSPKLDWESEAEFVKQSNIYQQALISGIGSLLAFGLPAGAALGLFFLGMPGYLGAAAILIICVAECTAALYFVPRFATKNMEKIRLA